MNSIKSLLFSLALMLFLSCQPEPEEMKLSTDVLVNVLSDVHLVEGALLSVRPSDKDSLRNLYYGQIYEIHGITAEVFEYDMKLLKSRPKVMESVYQEVMNELNKKELDMKKEKEEAEQEDPKEKK